MSGIRNWGEAKRKPKEWGETNEEKFENVVGKWTMHLGRDKTFSKRMGREYRGRRGLGKLECDLQREHGARQEETL